MSQKEVRSNPLIKWVRGMAVSVRFKDEHVEETLDYVPRDNDVIIASYPKTGTTWMQYIVLQIVSKGETFPGDIGDTACKYAPFMERTGSAVVDAMPEPRIYKHHLPYDRVKKNPKSKVIYIHRNPEDTMVSYYHFMNNFHADEVGFDEHFEFFLSGDIAYGRYFEHVLSYLEHEKDENLLLVSYEKMKKDPRTELLRIAEFLGEEYHRHLVENKMALDEMLEKTSFGYMKKNINTDNPFRPNTKVKLFRQGTTGDGKNTLSPEQFKKLKSKAEEIMSGTELLKMWYGE